MADITPGVPPQTGGDVQFVREVSAPLYAARGWMKFLGVLMIIYGALMVLSIVGILICWLPIWIGILLLRAAGSSEMAQISGDKYQLIEALSKLKTYFTIYGILALIGLVAAAIALAVGGFGAITSALLNA
ncbi:MAG: DUF5362 family protein [Candidatus Eisenbacteria bacterium]